MELNKSAGFALAISAATLLVSSGAFAQSTGQSDDKVECVGVNACKGHGDCKTASNECKGHNECKGQGFLKITKADCKSKGGMVKS